MACFRWGVGGKATDTAYSGNLVGENRVFYVAPHPHAQEYNILNIEDVAEKGTCTSKQA
jgi:hypothetical protein